MSEPQAGTDPNAEARVEIDRLKREEASRLLRELEKRPSLWLDLVFYALLVFSLFLPTVMGNRTGWEVYLLVMPSLFVAIFCNLIIRNSEDASRRRWEALLRLLDERNLLPT
mgnify:CR=1 FL=1